MVALTEAGEPLRGFRASCDDVEEKQQKYVCFLMNEQEYAAPVADVLEIVPILEITPVFQTPSFVTGVVNLRGNIVAILDVRQFFGLPASRIVSASRLVILQSGGKTCGLVVDGLAKVRDFPDSALSVAPATMAGVAVEYLSGVVPLPDRPLMILNVDAIMNSEAIRKLGE